MPTDTGATDVNGAAARLSALINSEQSLPTEEREAEAQEAPVQEHEAEQPETELEGQETLEESTDTEDQAELYKVKVDGEEYEVPLEELVKGYQLEANYRKKTTALSKEREAVEQKAAEIDKQLSEAKSLIDAEIESLESKEMQELREYDPEAYYKQRDKIESKIRKYEALQEKRSKEQEARQQKLLEKEREALYEAFPDWANDSKKQAADAAELMEVMQGMGFSQQELNTLTDHRMFILADKARKLDQIQKANLQAKKVETKPKTMKPGQPSAPEDRKNQAIKDKWAKLKKTGSRHAAVDLLSTPIS